MCDLLQDEKIEPLGNNIKIVVSPSHTFGTDAILLANFASVKRKDIACDMGTGCGIIPMIWCKGETKQIYAVDIQPKAISQLEKSIELNGITGRIIPINCDLRSFGDALPQGQLDLVTMNPPYKPVGTGIESISEAERIARHEVCCTVEDACAAAKKLLKYGGRFCMCHRPERLADVIFEMRKNKIEPKRLTFVNNATDSAEPWLILIEGKKGGHAGLKINYIENGR